MFIVNIHILSMVRSICTASQFEKLPMPGKRSSLLAVTSCKLQQFLISTVNNWKSLPSIFHSSPNSEVFRKGPHRARSGQQNLL